MTQRVSLAGYEILGELGRGTTGIIYQARHPIKPDRLVALKTPRFLPESGNSEERWRPTCFRIESQLLALLTRDSDLHFTTLYDVVAGFGLPQHPLGFYAREYVDGSTLQQLATAGSLTLRTGISTLATLAKAVSLVHAQGFAHRNLHPSNVLVPVSGMPKLIGLGLSWLLAGSKLLSPGAPGVPAEVDVRALLQMLDWLCTTLRHPVPAPLHTMYHPASIPSLDRFADMLNSYLQVG
jgi:serine/threonine-protein kinase